MSFFGFFKYSLAIVPLIILSDWHLGKVRAGSDIWIIFPRWKKYPANLPFPFPFPGPQAQKNPWKYLTQCLWRLSPEVKYILKQIDPPLRITGPQQAGQHPPFICPCISKHQNSAWHITGNQYTFIWLVKLYGFFRQILNSHQTHTSSSPLFAAQFPVSHGAVRASESV